MCCVNGANHPHTFALTSIRTACLCGHTPVRTSRFTLPPILSILYSTPVALVLPNDSVFVLRSRNMELNLQHLQLTPPHQNSGTHARKFGQHDIQ